MCMYRTKMIRFAFVVFKIVKSVDFDRFKRSMVLYVGPASRTRYMKQQ